MDSPSTAPDLESHSNRTYEANSWLNQAAEDTPSAFPSHNLYGHESTPQEYTRRVLGGDTAYESAADNSSSTPWPVDTLSNYGATAVFAPCLDPSSLASLGRLSPATDDDLVATVQDCYNKNVDSNKRKAGDFDNENPRLLKNHRPEHSQGSGPISNSNISSISGLSSKDEEIESPASIPLARKTEVELATTPKRDQQELPPPSSDSNTGCPHGNYRLRQACRNVERLAPTPLRPAETTDEQRARVSHNVVERKYRNRLNMQFERLLSALPGPEVDGDRDGIDQPLSKAGVLDAARRRIKSLERECDALKRQRSELRAGMDQLREGALWWTPTVGVGSDNGRREDGE